MVPRPLLLGHRGARKIKSVPENTLQSFELALQHGCDGFEFDVRLTADAHAVICHDPTFGNSRVCNSTRNQLPLCPVLGDVLKQFAPRAFLDIELKVGELETLALRILRDEGLRSDYVLSSFLPEVVMELKARSSSVPVGIICDKKSQLAQWRQLPVDYVMVEQDLRNP